MLHRIKVWLVLHKRWLLIGGGVGALLIAVGLAVWFVPSLHSEARMAYHKARGFFIADDAEGQDVAVIATPDPGTKAFESVQQLEGQVGQQEKEIQQQHADLVQVQGQLKDAIAEVAKSNDMLQKQQDQWRAALNAAKSAPVSSLSEGSDTQIPVVPLPTVAPSSGEQSTQASGKVNLNTATVAQLDGLPGIGATYAQRIVDYRKQHGPFKTVDSVTDVSGIGPALLEKIRGLVEV